MQDTAILLSTAYFPPVEYFAGIYHAKKIYIEAEENYIKQSYRNRCRIYTADGIQALIIPAIKTTGNHTRIRDIKISYRERWQLNHWRAIAAAYQKSPYFQYYEDTFSVFLDKKHTFLFDFNMELLHTLLSVIGIKRAIKTTEVYEMFPEHTTDLRNVIHPKKECDLFFPPYTQVFHERIGFVPNLSVIDLIFNVGPGCREYLQKIMIVREE